MATVLTINSLSGVISPELNYDYKFTEQLDGDSVFFFNNFAYNKYKIFKNLQDAAISKNNIAFLTDFVELSSVLKEQQTTLNVSSMPSLLYLKQQSGSFYVNLQGTELVGKSNSKTPLFFVLVGDNRIEIRTSIEDRLEVSKSYPYKVYTAKKATSEEQLERQRFDIDMSGTKLTLRTNTAEGPRYLAFDCASTLRATGLMLNNAFVNNYLFEAESISRAELIKGTQFEMEFVKYFNQFESAGNKKNVYIEESDRTNTHWLVTTTLKQLANNPESVNVNIMPLKTNFAPDGTFLTKPNE